jgi:hypothetical protein
VSIQYTYDEFLALFIMTDTLPMLSVPAELISSDWGVPPTGITLYAAGAPITPRGADHGL